jgi:dynein heavy chain
LGGSALRSVELLLSAVYKPIFQSLPKKKWGEADTNASSMFRKEMDSFITNVRETLKSEESGIELPKPNSKYDISQAGFEKGDESMLEHTEGLLEEWCNIIEGVLAENATTTDLNGKTVDSSRNADRESDNGPMTELDYWRRRMQRITSIMEQLKTKDCKAILAGLNSRYKIPQDQNMQKLFSLLRRWKQIDIKITESWNESKDNVKYLGTLERFIMPLYENEPTAIVDTLPALMNSIKMVHTIARYYNTTERMTTLFVKCTNQMIDNCKHTILTCGDPDSKMWNKDAETLVKTLHSCRALNEAYQDGYRETKEKLETSDTGKRFDFNENAIFSRFDLFCRRLLKLIDMFGTIHQFETLAGHKLEGMENLISEFKVVITKFQAKRHDLLDYHNNQFDRDYVEFNVQISKLENGLKDFIDNSFESMSSIGDSLNLLSQYQKILQRDSLKADLASKFNVIFQNYGLELEEVQSVYEHHKHQPPIPRNLPPVAGSITWSRHLLQRIEKPMKKFEKNPTVLQSKDAKRVIRTYNKVARTLVAFEYLWYQAWVQSIEAAKSGLEASLIVRHPEDQKLYVNFDQEIVQLIREGKCLDRLGIEVPESAKIVLLQELKYKTCFNDLQHSLMHHERVVEKVIPVTAMLLRPQFADMDFKLRPGMITLTWTSMNIDAYRRSVQVGLERLEELVTNINGIVENRVEQNLKMVSKVCLVSLPQDRSFTLDEFQSVQAKNINRECEILKGKNIEIEAAVEDLVQNILSYPLDEHIEGIQKSEVDKMTKHYNNFMYQALLCCTKNSLGAVKARVAADLQGGFLYVHRPFFEVDVHLSSPMVKMNPSLDAIQSTINRTAQHVLFVNKKLPDWGQGGLPLDQRLHFFQRVTKDIEIVRVILLLTGSVQGMKSAAEDFLSPFKEYDWMWKEDKGTKFKEFMDSKPELEQYEDELRKFQDLSDTIERVHGLHNVGALSLNMKTIKNQLMTEAKKWKLLYADNLRKEAKIKMEGLLEYMRVTTGKLNREVNDLESLRFVMQNLKEVRDRESDMQVRDIAPIQQTYTMLEHYLPEGFIEKDEIDQNSELRKKWKELTLLAEKQTDNLAEIQGNFRNGLIQDVHNFKTDVDNFRVDYEKNGPMVEGIKPSEAVERLNRFNEEFKIRQRKFQLYTGGEDLFALPRTDYPLLEKTKKELELQDKLFGLYTDVMNNINDYKIIEWYKVPENIDAMTESTEGFSARCRKMPKKLRGWAAYNELKKVIEDFETVLPLLTELAKPSIKDRHWKEVGALCTAEGQEKPTEFDVLSPDFKLQDLLDADIVKFKDDIEEVTEGADKQLKIEDNLNEIDGIWSKAEFSFQMWKDRGIPVLKSYALTIEELEEAQMQLQTMLTMRHVTPFRERAQAMLKSLSDTSEIIERWIKVSQLWQSLESVFTGGDIAKNMPLEAKWFSKVDKEFEKIMKKAADTKICVECCENEFLKNSLPVLHSELEKCQKSLEGYLEAKRNKFPRFYFVSNPGLLLILSQGSDPLSMNNYYEKVMDSISCVVHDKKDKTIIYTMHADGGKGTPEQQKAVDAYADMRGVDFVNPIKAVGNIEDWLAVLLKEMQITLKEHARNCAADIADRANDIKSLRTFVDQYIAQFALLGIQFMWTTDMQAALEQCRSKKTIVKEATAKQLAVLQELSSWCLQDLGPKPNRKKIETLVTVHVHQRDVSDDINRLHKAKKITDPNDFEWLKQARFAWRPNQGDPTSENGTAVISVCDVDFNYSYEYLGSQERLAITPLTDRCYITLSQALGMYFGGAPAGPAGTGKTETVKDLGRTLGIWVVVQNCTDQQKYTDCAKIFKGLCQGGLWGCFDEFNRITLPVLSVVAQQVLAIQNAKKVAKAGVENFFMFPGDPQKILLTPTCGFFITMNPGYAGRQELPENLKALFRGVAMMVPDFQIIKKVKLCSVGFSEFALQAQKFFVLYNTCKEQLSAQKHYDWGLRNILSVLRTAGATKRDNPGTPESALLYRTLRDMNLSKLVAQDVPLFLSLLSDLYPGMAPPPKGVNDAVIASLKVQVLKRGLIFHDDWVNKVIQLYDTTLVRHGIMLVGPTGGGKSRIFECLMNAVQDETVTGITHRTSRLNPKAIRAAEMYGEIEASSGEWVTGVFSAMWSKFNDRTDKRNTWMICDGPVDAIWIEDLNTVLDDNKLLTLANGDRFPMTENVKLMFEVETLKNASPATVSRAGIIYVSETDLDWSPVIEAWVQTQHESHQPIFTELFTRYMGKSTPTDVGHLLDFLARNTAGVMSVSRVGQVARCYNLINGLLCEGEDQYVLSNDADEMKLQLEKVFIYCLCWSLGGLLEFEDRVKFDKYIRQWDENSLVPEVNEGETVFEYFVNQESFEWEIWKPPAWSYPEGDKLDFSNLLVPTMDSTRALFLMQTIHRQKLSLLMVGSSGTAKTSTAFMYFNTLDPESMLIKKLNFSSATTPALFQFTVEGELDKRGGRNFGPPNNKAMTLFIDDISMPEVNNWGDQTTLEAVRLVIEHRGFCFLDKDKRGDFKICEDLQWVAAMGHPGGGRNDIPNRLKRHFYIFNLVLPAITSINDIYGQMLSGRFTPKLFSADVLEVTAKFTQATIQLWDKMKNKMLPTPAKFHYVFNMRELSRVFQGVLLTPVETIVSGGGKYVLENVVDSMEARTLLLGVWRHECDRVFCDKLTTNVDKGWYNKYMDKHTADEFGSELADVIKARPLNMVNFLREDVYDEEDVFVSAAPKVYEVGGTTAQVRERVMHFLGKHNEAFPQKAMQLILFDAALEHLLRISRLIEMPRGSALLVGVGGSGKQSLTRLAAFIASATCFQVTLTKQYGMGSLMEDLRTLYRSAGHKRQQTVFLFTESEIKEEIFLEVINSVLMTGEVVGLFAKDEMMAMTADLYNSFVAERPGEEPSQVNLKQYFTDCVRDNLHLVLCMSPLNPMFPIRAMKFPGLISGPTIDWFLAWPEEALIAVSQGFIREYPVDCDEPTKEALMVHMGNVHAMVTVLCEEYKTAMRRNVYQTPKSYLSFIQAYKDMYGVKLAGIKKQESNVNLGLQKLIGGAKDVEEMKKVLAKEQVKLKQATEDTNKMLGSLEVSSMEAKQEGEQVAKIKTKCEDDAKRIAGEKAACEVDLAKAQPLVDEANNALSGINNTDINNLKANKKPVDILQLVVDGCCILLMQPMNPVIAKTLTISKQEVPFIQPSYKDSTGNLSSGPGYLCLANSDFLKWLAEFGAIGKDEINEETIELMCPYMDLGEFFLPDVAKSASGSAAGLCTWVRAMKFYHEASKIVKPKLEALQVAAGQMAAANKALKSAEERLQAVKERLDELQNLFEASMAEKKRIEDGANSLARKMDQAKSLIDGLAGERVRWTEDSNNFADVKRRLVGDCAVACAFVSYCGPFNQDFRKICIVEKFTADCNARKVPVTDGLDVVNFLVDQGTVGDWNIEGLPTDPLSVQNGILVTKSSRYPLLIDPQGQAIGWIGKREAANMPVHGTTTVTHPKLKDQLEFAMGEGKALVIINVEETLDPMLDPVLEKQIIYKGKGKMSINVSDKNMEFSKDFMMYFITRLPNPHFSPELQAKTTVIDFTVTQKGLEEQLLGKVIGKLEKALEDQLNQVLEDMNSNTKALQELDTSLLERLTSNDGNLLDDEELIGVLGHTKKKAADVKEKLLIADETKKNINEKREQFRPVATRGSVLYFSILEMSLVNEMYQTSLNQFLGLFMLSMDRAEKATLASKRVENIIEKQTYMVYRYINRGLYERHKLLFTLLITIKILVTAEELTLGDVTLFLRGGAALDINSVRRKPFNWIGNDAWLNAMQLSISCKFFSALPNEMSGNEAMWRRWYEDNEPEAQPIPDYENRISENEEIGPFLKLLLVRSLRMDRAQITCREFIQHTKQMGKTYVDPVVDKITDIYEEMVADTPVIYLLSIGADPTEAIENLARKNKKNVPATISLGEGQEPVAIKAMNQAAINGDWVLLQNCELGLGLMVIMEEYLGGLVKDPGFRLFITAMPSKEFPLGLLQMSTKVTNEPPAGLQAGLLRSYTVTVTTDRLERVESAMWRQLLYCLCFLHSVVQERKKFGPLGWCIPYEYNTGDLTACIQFLEKHLYTGAISWPTLQYMVAEAQYGGKITDGVDRRLFGLYTKKFLIPKSCEEGFTYNPEAPLFRIPDDFVYKVPVENTLEDYQKYCSSMPDADSPEIFGLHPNADLTYRMKEVNTLIATLAETQPKGGGGGGVSKEEMVFEKAHELLDRLPEDYNEDDYKAKIKKLGGLTVPLNIFLFQEIQRLQNVIGKVRFMLTQMQMAIRGEVVMTDELQGALDAIAEAKVPHTWTFTVAGDEFSWILPTLGLWFSSLLSRDEQDRTWLNHGRPDCYWLTGFFNPQGMLTAMKQEVTRQHTSEKWALDDVVYHTEVTGFERQEKVTSSPAEGIYIYGLFLEGCAWSKQEGTLIESEPKKLFVPLPVLLVSGNIKENEKKVRKDLFGSSGPYESPVYKYPSRTDRYFIFFVDLKCTIDKNPVHWGLRGVALLCNTD